MPLIVRNGISGLVKLIASLKKKYEGGDLELVSTDGIATYVAGAKLTDTKMCIAFSDETTKNLYAAIVDTSDGSISCGTPVLIANHGTYSKTVHMISTEVERLNDNAAIIVYSQNEGGVAYRYAVSIFISGKLITVGNSVKASSKAFNNVSIITALTNLEDNKVLMIYTNNSPNTDSLTARIITLSGSELLFGTETVLNTAILSGAFPRVDKVSSSVVFVAAGCYNYNPKGYKPTYYKVTISGDEISSSNIFSAKQKDSTGDSGYQMVYAINESTYIGLTVGGSGSSKSFRCVLRSLTSQLAYFKMPKIFSTHDRCAPIHMVKKSDTEVDMIYISENGVIMNLPITYTSSSLTAGTAVEVESSLAIHGYWYRFVADYVSDFPLITIVADANGHVVCSAQLPETT